MLKHPHRLIVLLALLGSAVSAPDVRSQIFEPTGGTHAWNDSNNWGPGPPQPFPNSVGAAAELPAPTAALRVELGQPITIGSLTINKSTSATFDTTVAGTASNGLAFEGGGTIATTASFADGGGASIIAAPVSFSGPLTVTQGDDGILRFTQALSGSGDVIVNRTTDGTEFVAFNAANTYAGTTTVAGNAGTNFHVLRLGHAESIPGGIGATGGTSNITLTNSGILGLDASDFKRSIGTGPDQIQFVTPVNSGFASFNGTRVVNIGGESATVNWATAGLGQLALGAPTATGTVDFQNPLNLGNAANRNIRVIAGVGPAEIDAIISGSISSTGAANNLTKVGGGTLSLRAANSYTGATIINGGALRIDHPQALPAGTNIVISGVAVLGLGVADFAANLGAGPGEVQFTGDGNGGFAAYNGDRKVTLNGGAGLTWGQGSFVGDGRNFILSFEGSDALLEFTNPIDLSGGIRTLAGRDSSAAIDSRLSGVLSGDGGILKTQAGTLDLSAANTYTGVTTTQGGVLLLTNANSVPGGINGGSIANITLNGGSLGLGHGNFTAPLGFGPGEVQWSAGVNAGFSAFGGDRIVNLGGAGAQVAWGVNGFANNNLILNWESADSLLEFANAIDLNGGARTLAARDGLAEIDSRISGVISGTGSINKTQPGTLELTAANTYDGGTTVGAGRLLVNNTVGSGVGTGDVAVNANATLGGAGTIGTAADAANVTVNANGHLAPGHSPGVLTVHGNVSFLAGSFFDTELAGLAAGTGFDQLVINGAATLDGTLQVELLNGFAPALGNAFQILSATGGVNGAFANTLLPALSGGLDWDVVYSGNSVSLSVIGSTGLVGDYNQNGTVDAADYVVWRSSLGDEGVGLPADGNGNGLVDADDYQVWRANFGASSAGSASSNSVHSVPEPATLALFAWMLPLIAQIRSLKARFRRTGAPGASTNHQR